MPVRLQDRTAGLLETVAVAQNESLITLSLVSSIETSTELVKQRSLTFLGAVMRSPSQITSPRRKFALVPWVILPMGLQDCFVRAKGRFARAEADVIASRLRIVAIQSTDAFMLMENINRTDVFCLIRCTHFG